MTQNEQFYDRVIRYYDAENAAFVEDLELYAELADETDGPVLVIGCGTGRVLLNVAAEGHYVTGLDRSAAMLARARAKLAKQEDISARVTLQEADALTAEYTGPYPLIVVPYNTFMHFHTQESQLALLERCAAALETDGLLVMDLPNAAEAFATQDDDGIMWERTFTEPESGHIVMEQSTSRIDRAEQMLNVTWIYDELSPDGTVRRTLAPLTLRYVMPGEIHLLLRLAGLRVVELYGDYDQSAFEDGAPRMIVLAEKI